MLTEINHSTPKWYTAIIPKEGGLVFFFFFLLHMTSTSKTF